MRCPTLAELPTPPQGKTGWPWTVETPPSPTVSIRDLSLKITIVTPSFNQGKFLEETIRSILLQGYDNLEYMVLDGGSTDESVEIINKYASFLTLWRSEQDRGQSSAINDGLHRGTGEIFNWINSDDVLQPGALQSVAAVFGGFDVVAGGVTHFRDDGFSVYARNAGLTALQMITETEGYVFQQPGVFFSREKALAVGALDDTSRYIFDWEFMIRYLIRFPKVKYIDQDLAHFRLHDKSKTVGEADTFNDDLPAVLAYFAANGFSQEFRQAADLRRRKVLWADTLRHARSKSGSRLARAISIGTQMLADPSARVSRFTFGALRRILARQ